MVFEIHVKQMAIKSSLNWYNNSNKYKNVWIDFIVLSVNVLRTFSAPLSIIRFPTILFCDKQVYKVSYINQ